MSKAHTPGPWTQGSSESGRSCVWLDGNQEPADQMGHTDNWIDCNTEANARLIAAAPEMLEALKLIANAENSALDLAYCKGIARAAITKAGEKS